ncbi:histidine kinase [Herbiconiux sp. CPCC 203407]|uniref:Histidine kinase n=1 Tax=Herbiconiux oxytropis TaxID=2970915 RepID=A0AA41XIC6_9MICO|nr:histidine kinase [Herbiconiux oxytropis]MCS5724150.1 histidine kinase [Herbiconiux oxytropis]MCS5726915.1 histidine kinase [Herbiconiux oxytropis]
MRTDVDLWSEYDLDSDSMARIHVAAQQVVSELDLELVLVRFVERAAALVGARRGAFGVLGRDGAFYRFVFYDEPGGEGLSPHSPFDGLHAGTRPRDAFVDGPHLRASVESGGTLVGTLFLAGPASGSFSREDDHLTRAFAGVGGVAIENARRYDDSARRIRSSLALSELSAELLAACSGEIYDAVARNVEAVVPSAFVTVVRPLPPGDQWRVEAAVGLNAPALLGGVYARKDSLAERAFASATLAVSSGPHEISVNGVASRFSCVIAVPLVTSEGVTAVIHFARGPGSPWFHDDELECLSDFGVRAGRVVESASTEFSRQRQAVVDERSRIARDLHDTVIQRLFAIGLNLQALGSVNPLLGSDIDVQTRQIDSAIIDLRSTVFELAHRASATAIDVRRRIIRLFTEYATNVEVVPHVTFRGPLDVVLPPGLADDIVAVVREAVSNIQRHAEGAAEKISVDIGGTGVQVVIDDIGAGIDPFAGPGGGMRNLSERARRRGGTFEVLRRSPQGTRVRWSVPLESEPGT